MRAEPTLFRLPQHPGTNGRPATRHRGRRRTLSIVRIWTKVDASTENISLVYFTVSPVKRLCLVINGALAQTPPCINPDAEMTKPVNVRPPLKSEPTRPRLFRLYSGIYCCVFLGTPQPRPTSNTRICNLRGSRLVKRTEYGYKAPFAFSQYGGPAENLRKGVRF